LKHTHQVSKSLANRAILLLDCKQWHSECSNTISSFRRNLTRSRDGRDRRVSLRSLPGRIATIAISSLDEGSMSAQRSTLCIAQTTSRTFSIVRIHMLLALLESIQCDIVAGHEFLAALFTVQTVLLQMALDTFTCDIRAGTHELHDGGRARVLEAHVKNSGYKISMQLIRPGKTLRPPLIRSRTLPLLASSLPRKAFLNLIRLRPLAGRSEGSSSGDGRGSSRNHAPPWILTPAIASPFCGTLAIV